MSETTNLETALKNEITITNGGETYVFKVPSIKDRIKIAATGAELRRESDPKGNGITLGYDPSAVMFTDTLAIFIVLLKSSTALWIYSKDGANNPVMDLDKWPDNVPIMEVVSQFNDELEKFRA